MKMNDFLKQIAMDMNINNREFNSDDFYYLLTNKSAKFTTAVNGKQGKMFNFAQVFLVDSRVRHAEQSLIDEINF